MATSTRDYDAIIGEVAGQLEARFAEIQDQMKPLREEERQVAEAIHRISGAWPTGYVPNEQPGSPVRTGTRSPRQGSGDVRKRALDWIARHPEGVNATQVAEGIGVGINPTREAIKALLESKEIRQEGERRNRKLYPAEPTQD